MPISTDMIVRVAHADVALARMPFSRSVAYWQRPEESQRPWKVLKSECNAILIGKDDGVIIDGNCTNKVSAPDGGAVHIYGDLASAIEIAGHSEVIVTGDVLPQAKIQTAGICSFFIGGEFFGDLDSPGSLELWIESNFNGTVRTGRPSTIYVKGDYNGSIIPSEHAGLLWLTVGGFASHNALSKIAERRYTQFNASIARSDVAPGLYPANGHVKKPSGGNSFSRWCVLSGP